MIPTPRRHPMPPDDLALDLWLRSALVTAYDAILREPVPEHLLLLAQEVVHCPNPGKRDMR